MKVRVLIREKPDRRNLQLYYVDPLTGKEETKSAKTNIRREAERAAARWEAELASGRQAADPSWDAFRQRFRDEHLSHLAAKSRSAYGTAMNAFERTIGSPRAISAISPGVLSQFAAELKQAGQSADTIASYLRHLVASLSWAAKVGMISHAPKCIVPKTGKRRLARARAVTEAEYTKLIEAAGKVGRQWERLLEGLWLSGLRIGEALSLSWDSPPLRVDLDGRRPKIVAWAEGHKSRKDDLVPITPDFYAFLVATPERERIGKVFPMGCARRRVVDTLAEIGSAVVVSDTGKTATAHDLRRSFGTRWALKVHPIVLQRLMRHADIQTTMTYYVHLDADAVSDELWKPLTVPEVVPESRQ